MNRPFAAAFALILFAIIVISSHQNAFAGDIAENAAETNELSNITPKLDDDLAKSRQIAEEISKVVGISISPLLGMSVLGSYNYYTTPLAERGDLVWYNQPVFWGPLLGILLLFIFKDSAKTATPIPKPVFAPFDALEVVENKVSGLVGLAVVLASILTLDPATVQIAFQELGLTFPSVAHASQGGDVIASSLSTLQIGLVAAFAFFCFVMVWLVSNTINMLILLCPFATIDFLLKMFRNFVIALLLGAALLHPFAGLLVSLVIVVISYFLAGISFRLMVFGNVFSSDILFKRWNKYEPGEAEFGAFAGKEMAGVPFMSYGTVSKTDNGELQFSYKPWLLLATRTVRLPRPNEDLAIGKGTFSPTIVRLIRKPASYRVLFRLRPLYKFHEEFLARSLGSGSIHDVSFGKGVKAGCQWLLEQLGASGTVAPEGPRRITG